MGDISTYDSAAELKELIDAVEAITKQDTTNSPNLLCIARGNFGKLSEKTKD